MTYIVNRLNDLWCRGCFVFAFTFVVFVTLETSSLTRAFPMVFDQNVHSPFSSMNSQQSRDNVLASVIEAEQALEEAGNSNDEQVEQHDDDNRFIVDESRLAECLTACYHEFQRCTATYQDVMTASTTSTTTTEAPSWKPTASSHPVCDRGQKKCEFGCLSKLVAETTGQLEDFTPHRDSARNYFVDDGLNDGPLEESAENEEDIIKL